MTAAVVLICDWAFDELPLDRLDLHIHPDNAKSLAVARRAGFTDTGRRTPTGDTVWSRSR